MSAYLQILGQYLSPVAARAALLGLCLVAATGLQLYIPQIIRSFIDLAAAKGPAQELTRLALTYLGFAVVNQLLSAAATYLSADVGWAATNALRADLIQSRTAARHAVSQGPHAGRDDRAHRRRRHQRCPISFPSSWCASSAAFCCCRRTRAAVARGLAGRAGADCLYRCGGQVLHWRRADRHRCPTRDEREASAAILRLHRGAPERARRHSRQRGRPLRNAPVSDGAARMVRQGVTRVVGAQHDLVDDGRTVCSWLRDDAGPRNRALHRQAPQPWGPCICSSTTWPCSRRRSTRSLSSCRSFRRPRQA